MTESRLGLREEERSSSSDSSMTMLPQEHVKEPILYSVKSSMPKVYSDEHSKELNSMQRSQVINIIREDFTKKYKSKLKPKSSRRKMNLNSWKPWSENWKRSTVLS